ncbi:MAG: MarR family transcriptional regulator [Chloroflexi bacterium]|nr:MarR family transcriptional regulator [Chloroflexota bacterium]
MASAALVRALESIIIFGVAVTVEALDDAAPVADLTLPMWRVMVVLGEGPDGATVSEVARRIRVTVPATSRQLRRLAARGLVDLAMDERDHRAVRAHLTEQGHAVRERVMAHRRTRIAEALGSLDCSATTDEELTIVAHLLDRRIA